jgi:hypothetical protein
MRFSEVLGEHDEHEQASRLFAASMVLLGI